MTDDELEAEPDRTAHETWQLGELVQGFNYLEFMLHLLCWTAIGVGEPTGRSLTRQLSVDGVRQMLRRLLDNDVISDEAVRDMAERAVRRLSGEDGFIRRRNLLVHSFAMGTESPSPLFFLRDWLGGKDMSHLRSHDEIATAQLVAEVHQLAHEIGMVVLAKRIAE